MSSLRAWTLPILYVVSILSARSIVAQECGFHGHGRSDLEDHHSHESHQHHDGNDQHLCGGHHHHGDVKERLAKLPEELAEEEDLKSMGFSSHHHHHEDADHSFNEGTVANLGLWARAMGCSLLVSMASLICLILLPVFLKGNPSKLLVDSLAVFGAGAMLGDAFLHQLPHALGGTHGSHSHSHVHAHDHLHNHEHVEGHTHSVGDLLVGLSVLSGIVCFLLVEKIVRYVEDVPGKEGKSLAHHHHHRPRGKKVNDHEERNDHQNDAMLDKKKSKSGKKKSKSEITSEAELLDGTSNEHKENTQQGAKVRLNITNLTDSSMQRRVPIQNGEHKKENPTSTNNDATSLAVLSEQNQPKESSNLVFGYLNLFSDGVHNFTDGMALGSAFLLHGSVGGWSRTLFLLAHELPQEVGDFGILVRSGFSVFQALFFNFLSALVALAGTALALILGQDPGNSSLIEGFTAGGFIYIAVAGVLPEMNSGESSFRRSAIQMFALILGMSVALFISLYE